MAFFRDSWGGRLSTRPVKILLLHVYVVYLGFAIWGCASVNEGITLDKLAADDSYVADYFDRDIRYFRLYGHAVNVVVGKEMELWKKTERNRIETVLREFEESEYFHGHDVTSAWIRDFNLFIGSNDVDSGNFSQTLGYFVSNYSLLNVNYNMDIKTESGKVKYSRFFVFSNNTDTSIRESEMMSTARAIADRHKDLNVTVYHPTFVIYDQYLAVWPNTCQNLLIATATMFVVSLFLIPHPVCSLWVTFSIVSICTGVIGYMTWWDVNLDTISMINIIICIGFSVDFSAHITYAFVLADGDTGNQRMRNALYALGYPITQGALSTILGVSVLVYTPSYIYRTFFKTMFLVILLGAFHGLFIIPVLLSVMGPKKHKSLNHTQNNMHTIRSVTKGVDGWRKRDFDHIECEGGFHTPRGYRDDCQPNMSELPHRESSPVKYLSNPRVRDRGVKTNQAPMSYANNGMALPYRTSVPNNSWPGGQGSRPSLS